MEEKRHSAAVELLRMQLTELELRSGAFSSTLQRARDAQSARFACESQRETAAHIAADCRAAASARNAAAEAAKAAEIAASLQPLRAELLGEALALATDDGRWGVFAARLSEESRGTVALTSLPADGAEFAAVRRMYLPLLAARHRGGRAEILRVFRVRVDDPRAPAVSAVEARGLRRIGASYGKFASLPELVASLQVSAHRRKEAWRTPPHSASPVGAQQQLNGGSRTPPPPPSKSPQMEERRSLSAEALEILTAIVGPDVSVAELARQTMRNEEEEEEEGFEEMHGIPLTVAQPDEESALWKTRTEQMSKLCDGSVLDWKLGPRAFSESARRLPLFRADVLLDSTVVRWMRPQWNARLAEETTAIFFCCSEPECGDAVDGISSFEGIAVNLDRFSQRLESIPSIATKGKSFQFAGASIKELVQCRQLPSLLLDQLSDKEQKKLAERYGEFSCQVSHLFVCETAGNGRYWITALSDVEILELVGAFLVRLPRLPAASLVFPDFLSSPLPLPEYLPHRYCFLYPNVKFSSNVRPDFLIQYDVYPQVSSSRSASSSSSPAQKNPFSCRCAWIGCQSTCTEQAKPPLLYLCSAHAAVFFGIQQRTRSPPATETFPEVGAETLVSDSRAIERSMPLFAALLKGKAV